jgi:hypothetical protein
VVGLRRISVPVVAIVVAAGVVAGCGGTSHPSAAAPAGSSTSSAAGAAASRQQYRACLSQHGVALPTRPAGGYPPGQGGGGYGGGYGGGFGGASANPTTRAAMQACAQYRPKNGFGGRGGFNSTAMQAFRNCLSQHGVTLPTRRPGSLPTSGATPGQHRGVYGGLNTADPTVAKALSVCKVLLPTSGSTGTPGSAAGGATS